MIYVCIPSHDEGPTIGLVLWKIRKVFEAFPREYQILVADDGSTDETAEILKPYTNVLSLTVIRHPTRLGTRARSKSCSARRSTGPIGPSATARS